MALTALIAVWIGCPLYVYRQLMAIPVLKLRELKLVVVLVAVSLFVLTYGLWVVLRGPDVFSRLASAIRNMKAPSKGTNCTHQIQPASLRYRETTAVLISLV